MLLKYQQTTFTSFALAIFTNIRVIFHAGEVFPRGMLANENVTSPESSGLRFRGKRVWKFVEYRRAGLVSNRERIRRLSAISSRYFKLDFPRNKISISKKIHSVSPTCLSDLLFSFFFLQSTFPSARFSLARRDGIYPSVTLNRQLLFYSTVDFTDIEQLGPFVEQSDQEDEVPPSPLLRSAVSLSSSFVTRAPL